MKKLFIIIALFFISFSGFSTDGAKDLTKNSTAVKDTIIKTQTFKIWQGSKGGKFIIKIAKDGHEYKQYLKK